MEKNHLPSHISAGMMVAVLGVVSLGIVEPMLTSLKGVPAMYTAQLLAHNWRDSDGDGIADNYDPQPNRAYVAQPAEETETEDDA